MDSVRKRRPTIVVPGSFRLEVASALVRRLEGKAAALRHALVDEAGEPLFRTVLLDQELIDHAVVLGEEFRLTTMDAIYATIAVRYGLPLVSFDGEIVGRTSTRIRVISYDSLLSSGKELLKD
jgi:predicted nucleic acid-binding protein